MSENKFLNAALELVELGYPVLPLRPGEKIPLLPGGYKVASTDPAKIREWWQQHPKVNLGISTANLLVLDLDAPDGLGWPDDGLLNRELQERAGAVARSPRGGLHLYFANPELVEVRCSAGKLGRGVDVRAAGGHITAPPSRTATGSYTWLRKPPPLDALPEPPDWLLERLAALERPAPVAAAPVSAAVNGSINGHAPAALAAEALEIIPEGKRKSTLVSLAGKLRDRGLSLTAIEAAIRAENAARCRPPLPDAEVEDVLRSASRWRPGHLPAPQDDGDVCLADVQEREVEWLWPDRFPLGFISAIAGRQGQGKSLVAIDIAARVTSGAPWPDGSGVPPVGGVVVVNLEDDAERVLKGRLRVAGADAERVRVVTTPIETFEVERIERIIDRTPNCRLLIIDPVGNHVGGKTDTFKDNSVRAALAPLAEIAKQRNLTVLLVYHLKKTAADAADFQVLGSVAFTALPRAVWHVLPGERPKDGDRLLASGKMNLARPAPGLQFRIMGRPPVIAWGEALPPDQDADAIIAEQRRKADEKGRRGPRPAELLEATKFLENLLARGPLMASELFDQAEQAGISRATLRRAKAELGITPRKTAEGWVWTLPGWKPPTPSFFDQ